MNDQIYKNWRKDVGTDYETTLRLVDEDYTRANISRNTEDELTKMNEKLTEATAMKELPPFMTFRRQDRVVGALDFDGHKLVFTGDADESAKSLFDALAIDWDRRLAEAVNAEREACAKVCEDEGERFKHHPSGRQDFSICAAAIRARGET